jgi:hypothetical protein
MVFAFDKDNDQKQKRLHDNPQNSPRQNNHEVQRTEKNPIVLRLGWTDGVKENGQRERQVEKKSEMLRDHCPDWVPSV